jgi:sarcosine oxidase gamma subunit
MLDRGLFWTPAAAGAFSARDVAISVVSGLRQTLVSGVRPLAAPFCAGLAPVGFSGIARGPTYAVALARDRLLVVSENPIEAAEGFDAATATALTHVDDAWVILDLEGPELADLIAKATSLDFTDASPSASLIFAGLTCIAYRYERPSRLRLHIERPLAAAFAEWARRL